jgi:hypothetical protein
VHLGRLNAERCANANLRREIQKEENLKSKDAQNKYSIKKISSGYEFLYILK